MTLGNNRIPVSDTEIDPHRHRQLFLDDGAIASMSGVRRVLHRPVRNGPVIVPDRSRGQCAVQSSSVPQWNPERNLWEWWYKGFTTYTDEYLTLYATSVDGVHWDTPNLGRYEWNGCRSNNVAFVSEEANLCHVIRDAADPDATHATHAPHATHEPHAPHAPHAQCC